VINANDELIDLGTEGISYVKTSLQQGSGLCAEVLQLPLANGGSFAPLPRHTTVERAKKFDIGGVTSRRDSLAWLADHVQSLWQAATIGTLVIQDIWAKPSDPPVYVSAFDKFVDGENIYYFIDGSNAEFRCIQGAARAVTSYLFVAFLSRISFANNALPHDRFLPRSLIGEIARATEEIFVGAYDQEGLVVWHR
jgi:hypothetical protein